MKNIIFPLLIIFCLQGSAQNNVPISSLPAADTLGSPDFYPVVQGGHYKRIDVGVISKQLDSFVNSKVLSGPTGTTGPQGATGITGAVGATGPTGAGATDSVNNGLTNNANVLQLGGPLIQNTVLTGYKGTDTFAFQCSDSIIYISGPHIAVKGMGLTDRQGMVAGIVDLTPFGGSSSSLLLGEPLGNSQIVMDSGKITIQDKKTVIAGHLQLQDGTQANNYFLSSDTYGNTSWQQVDLDSASIMALAWGVDGNDFTGLPISPHLGTRDTFDLIFICGNDQAGRIWHDLANTAIGREAFNNLTNGNDNSAFGYQAGDNNTSGSNNTDIGNSALWRDTSGSHNTAIGVEALFNNSNGSYNSACGTSALSSNFTGNYNTAIGYYADIAFDTISYATAIGANAIAGESHAIVLGSATSLVYVGIGTPKPQAMLDIELSSPQSGEVAFKMSDGTQGSSRVLSCDSVGNGHWVIPTITAAELTTLYSSLPQYTTDAAAGTGGLTTGQPYVNSTTYALTFKQ